MPRYEKSFVPKQSVQRMIKEQSKKEGKKDLSKLTPIDHGTIANPHTAVYKIHRYFARRPYSVFNELIQHYSNPGSIILDPFCGGGVTIIEGLRLRRKVVGVDLNPLATFITEMEAADAELPKINKIIDTLEKRVKKKILRYYQTKCPDCGNQVPFYWMKWAYVFDCPNCHRHVAINDLTKKGSGRFVCKYCKKPFMPIEAKKIDEIPFEMEIRCECGFNGSKTPDAKDLLLVKNIKNEFSKSTKSGGLWYPEDEFPNADRQRDDAVYQKGIKHFKDFYTSRNLLALAILLKEIKKFKTVEGRLVLLSFTDTLGWTSKMSSEPGHGWQHHAYWLPYIYYECNVWEYFQRRLDVMLRGKEYSEMEIDGFYKKAKSFSELKNQTCLILTGSSEKIPVPNGKVDAVITDPPYGGNVQYLELSQFYLVWVKKLLKTDINKSWMKEAVETRHTGFVTEKSSDHYRSVLLKIFKECHRVLRPGGWLVMTFHNKNFKVWNTLHSVVHDAGFLLSEEDGMIYQPPIQNYTQTMHTRASGAMLGDFVLSFRRLDAAPTRKMIDDIEIGSKVRRIAAETIQYHGGANLSTIYRRLIPFLLNNGLLHKLTEKDVTKYLHSDFEEKNGKWYFKDNVTEVEGIRPLDYIPVEARLEYLVRSVFYDKDRVTLDQIVIAIFTNLVNSNAAEYEEITKVLQRLAEPTGDGRYWKIRENISPSQATIIEWMGETKKAEEIEGSAVEQSEISLHDFVIERLCDIGMKAALEAHIGETEQRKYMKFRKMSTPMGKNIYGIPEQSLDKIKEIDVIWLKERGIIAAFEVENSTTIDSGITRFRELFAATPALNILAYIVVPDKRVEEAKMKIGSLANRKEKLPERIKIIRYSDLNDKSLDLEKVAISVL